MGQGTAELHTLGYALLIIAITRLFFLCDFTPLNNMAAESLDWASMARNFEFSNRQNTSRPWFPLDFGD